jgi:cell fate regulator YaaT (PSP1 superfamily)
MEDMDDRDDSRDDMIDLEKEDMFESDDGPRESDASGGPASDTDAGAFTQTAADPQTAAPSGPGAPEAQAAAAAPAGQKASDGAVYRVKILYSSATEFCRGTEETAHAAGDMVVVTTKYGNELAKVLGRESDAGESDGGEIRAIVRRAAPADLSRVGENDMKEGRAFAVCREKIETRGLSMKLISAHYLLDEQKILFFFTAESRIDFRELVKDLVSVFKMRIELRQIGVRDEARVVGGMGICGRVLCCNSVTDRLRPVSIKMAKEQNLTLNSMKISGPCGRLLCCLSYEFDVYREARQQFPPLGTRILYDGEEFKVAEMNVLARRVRLQGGSGRVLDLGFDALARDQKTNAWQLHIRSAASDKQ